MTSLDLQDFRQWLKANNGNRLDDALIANHAPYIMDHLLELCRTKNGCELTTQFLSLPDVIDQLMSAEGFMRTKDPVLVAKTKQKNLGLMNEFVDMSGDEVAIPHRDLVSEKLTLIFEKLSVRQCQVITEMQKDAPDFSRNLVHSMRCEHWDAPMRVLNNRTFGQKPWYALAA